MCAWLKPIVGWIRWALIASSASSSAPRARPGGSRGGHPTLYVCNHVSYLDARCGRSESRQLVAKAEVATWPFSQRWPRRSAPSSSSGAPARPHHRDEMMRRLNTGDISCGFPGQPSRRNRRAAFLARAVLAWPAAAATAKRSPLGQSGGYRLHAAEGSPLGRYWRPVRLVRRRSERVPHLWQIVALARPRRGHFLSTVDIDALAISQ